MTASDTRSNILPPTPPSHPHPPRPASKQHPSPHTSTLSFPHPHPASTPPRTSTPHSPLLSHRLAQVLEHEAEGAGGIRHGVRAHAHDEAVVVVVRAADVHGDLSPVRGTEARAVQQRLFFFHRGIIRREGGGGGGARGGGRRRRSEGRGEEGRGKRQKNDGHFLEGWANQGLTAPCLKYSAHRSVR